MEQQPLAFVIPQPPHPIHGDSFTIKIQLPEEELQAQPDFHDTGLVMWPSAVLLSRWMTNHKSVILEQLDGGDILELGAGCGLVGLVAATMIRQDAASSEEGGQATSASSGTTTTNVILTDYSEQARHNLEHNCRLNNLESCTSVLGLDFFDQQEEESATELNTSTLTTTWTDTDGNPQPQVSLILASDILCYSNDADLVAQSIQAALVEGGHAIVVSETENIRFGVAGFEEALTNLGLEVQVTSLQDGLDPIIHDDGLLDPTLPPTTTTDHLSEHQQDLADDLDKTSRYHEGRNYRMFTIDKPMAAK